MNLSRFFFLITVLSRLWKCMEGLHWENIKANYEAQTYENDYIVGPGPLEKLGVKYQPEY